MKILLVERSQVMDGFKDTLWLFVGGDCLHWRLGSDVVFGFWRKWMHHGHGLGTAMVKRSVGEASKLSFAFRRGSTLLLIL